jgi:hypothetical protein
MDCTGITAACKAWTSALAALIALAGIVFGFSTQAQEAN